MAESTLPQPDGGGLPPTYAEDMRALAIFRVALERIWLGSDVRMGESAQSTAGTFQRIAHDALAAANQLQSPEVEYWIEPVPGSGATIPAFKAESKVSGLNWLNLESHKHTGQYQMRPRQVKGRGDGRSLLT